jgi:hypothetical protein
VAKRGVGYMILLLTVGLLLTPIPLSNVVPAIVISPISLAYVEQDGLFQSQDGQVHPDIDRYGKKVRLGPEANNCTP